jgi:hypothetical protein
MLTVVLIAIILLFGVPAFLLLIARLLSSRRPGRSNGLIGFPIDPPKPPEA